VWSISAITYETLYLNPAAEKVYGRPAAAFYQDPGLFLNSVHPEDRERVNGILPELVTKGSATIQYRIIRPDGEVRWLEDKLAVVRGPDGEPIIFGGVADDITERKVHEVQILHVATHDVLTGLPNRKLFNDRLALALARADRNKQNVALMFCDLDRFKEVNDTLGHKAGDELLKQVAARLKNSLREVDTVARIGGDEFTVIVEGVNYPEAAIVGQKIVDVLEPAIVIMAKECLVSPSVGIALYPADARDAENLIRLADTAMYYVKRHGRNNYKFYSADLDARIVASA
jgi:diguanylate cyclase (GGDEF)-like protein/PAS domain S-box-containing protein